MCRRPRPLSSSRQRAFPLAQAVRPVLPGFHRTSPWLPPRMRKLPFSRVRRDRCAVLRKSARRFVALPAHTPPKTVVLTGSGSPERASPRGAFRPLVQPLELQVEIRAKILSRQILRRRSVGGAGRVPEKLLVRPGTCPGSFHGILCEQVNLRHG